jgi:hypothetical protein
VIDQQGNVVIPFTHSYLSVVKEGYLIGGTIMTSKAGKKIAQKICPVVYNLRGETAFDNDCAEDPSRMLPGKVDKSGNYSEGGWPMIQEGKFVLEDINGDEFVAVDVRTNRQLSLYSVTFPDHYFRFREGVLAFQYEGEDGDGPILASYTDTLSFDAGALTENIRPFSFEANNVHPFFNGVAAIEQDGKWIFIDRKGAVISETALSTKEYRAAPPMYFNGLIGFFNSKNKAGYVNLKGETVIPFELDEYHPFESDVTPVKKNGLFGLLRKDGTWAVPPRFEEMYAAPCPCYQ